MSTPQPTPESRPERPRPGDELVVTIAKPAAAPQDRTRPGADGRGSGSRAALRYTLYRVCLFAAVSAVVWVIFYLIGLTGRGAGILVVGISLAVSGVLSYFLLNSQRDAMSAALVERVERAKARIDDGAAAEDHLIPEAAPLHRPTTEAS